jgi:hypothetical protein
MFLNMWVVMLLAMRVVMFHGSWVAMFIARCFITFRGIPVAMCRGGLVAIVIGMWVRHYVPWDPDGHVTLAVYCVWA